MYSIASERACRMVPYWKGPRGTIYHLVDGTLVLYLSQLFHDCLQQGLSVQRIRPCLPRGRTNSPRSLPVHKDRQPHSHELEEEVLPLSWVVPRHLSLKPILQRQFLFTISHCPSVKYLASATKKSFWSWRHMQFLIRRSTWSSVTLSHNPFDFSKELSLIHI